MANIDFSNDGLIDPKDFESILGGLPSYEEETQEETKEENTTEDDYVPLGTNKPESVGSEEDTKGDLENTVIGESSSPNNYSSIAKAFADDGVFQNLSEDDIKSVDSPEKFVEIMQKQISNMYDEQHKRVLSALDNGGDSNEIRKYEGILKQLNSYDSVLNTQDEQSEKLRCQIIYQDYINRGFSEDRAKRQVDLALKNGTDIQDATESLQSLKDYYQSDYDDYRKKLEEENKALQQKVSQRNQDLKKLITEDKNLFSEFVNDKATKDKIYETITKPVAKDANGKAITALQKYQMEHPNEFIALLGMFHTLTNGFTDLGGVLKTKVKKEVNSSMKNIERALNNTSRTATGNLDFTSGALDPQSKHTGLSLDLNF